MLVSLIDVQNNESFCGGSIISSKTILTALHCTARKPETLQIVVGEHNMDYDGDGQYMYNVDKIKTIQQSYLLMAVQDYALIILKEDIPWTFGASPICLPEENSFQDEDVKVNING